MGFPYKFTFYFKGFPILGSFKSHRKWVRRFGFADEKQYWDVTGKKFPKGEK